MQTLSYPAGLASKTTCFTTLSQRWMIVEVDFYHPPNLTLIQSTCYTKKVEVKAKNAKCHRSTRSHLARWHSKCPYVHRNCVVHCTKYKFFFVISFFFINFAPSSFLRLKLKLTLREGRLLDKGVYLALWTLATERSRKLNLAMGKATVDAQLGYANMIFAYLHRYVIVLSYSAWASALLLLGEMGNARRLCSGMEQSFSNPRIFVFYCNA